MTLIIVCGGVFLAILYARRSAELFDPQVWDEEGVIIQQIVSAGPASLFQPLNGYLVVLPRLISSIALFAGLGAYPIAVTLVTWAVTIGAMLLISFVPSHLRGAPLLAALALLVPTDPEVFGLPLYTLWWAGLLLLAAAFWKVSARHLWPYAALLVLCGLSSPLPVLLAPLYAIFAALERTRVRIVAAVIVTACAIIQTGMAFSSNATHSTDSVSIPLVVEKFAGGYVAWNLLQDPARDVVTFVLGALIIVMLAYVALRERSQRLVIGALAYVWIGSIALSILRVGVNILDPIATGPRYFFYPYIVEGWILVQLVFSTRTPLVRFASAALLVVAILNVIPGLSRKHDDLAWSSSIAKCFASDTNDDDVSIPIEMDGHAASALQMILPARQCRQLIEYGSLGLILGR